VTNQSSIINHQSLCLVTGGAGFIGSHLARKLIKEGHQVIVVDNLCEGKLKNIADILAKGQSRSAGKDKVKFYQEDILNLSSLQKIFKNVDYVFHQAALRSVERSVHNPLETNKVNIEGTLNILLAARDNQVKRVVFASSSSVYGEAKEKIFKETICPQPVSPYALSKLTGEFYLKQFYQLFGLETISLRYFNVYGPYQDPSNEYANVIPLFIVKMLKDEQPTIHWDGEQARDFNYIDDVVEANILAMRAKKTKGEVVNICNGKNYSINQMFEMINQILGKNIKATHGPKRAGDVRLTLGNPNLAKKVLGFKAKIDFKQGLEKTIEWFKKSS
jgi:nucleoside-diphosphate-sugar epimerase